MVYYFRIRLLLYVFLIIKNVSIKIVVEISVTYAPQEEKNKVSDLVC